MLVPLWLPSARAAGPPAAPAPTFTVWHGRGGWVQGLIRLPRSPERQPHAASSMSQAFKLPFYLNLCPRIQAEKRPFQSQFLLYGFMGNHGRQLLEISSCAQHNRGSRGWLGLGLFWGTDSISQPQTEPRSQPQTEPRSQLQTEPRSQPLTNWFMKPCPCS